MEYVCTTCGTDYPSHPSWQHAKDGRHFCSQRCVVMYYNTAITRQCPICGHSFKLSYSRRHMDRYQYCSSDCHRVGRFWSNIDKLGNGHWLWRKSYTHGYAHLTWNTQCDYAHRIAWLLTKGPIGRAYLVKMCDYHGCINPDHWSDTAKERRKRPLAPVSP